MAPFFGAFGSSLGKASLPGPAVTYSSSGILGSIERAVEKTLIDNIPKLAVPLALWNSGNTGRVAALGVVGGAGALVYNKGKTAINDLSILVRGKPAFGE